LPKLSVDSPAILEGNSGMRSAFFTVTLENAASVPVKIGYRSRDYNALAGQDYQAVEGLLVFQPGETSKIVAVPIIGDTLGEVDEVFFLDLTSENGTAFTAYPGTILNDDGAVLVPTLHVADAGILEGNSGIKSLAFTFSLSQPTTSPVSVRYGTTDGTAIAGSDYIAASDILTFAPGETTKTVSVSISGDLAVESAETFKIILADPTGTTLANSSAIGTIFNDDGPLVLPTLVIRPPKILEGDAGLKSLEFTFSLSQPNGAPVSVQYGTADNTAIAGSDYAATAGALTFLPGETTKTVSVPILGDQQSEASETLRLLLSGASGATLVQNEVTGTIIDDDLPPEIVHLVISKGGTKATWIDGDGDLVKLVSSKPFLALEDFVFGNDERGLPKLWSLNVSGSELGATSLAFSVQRGAIGDGRVDVEEIDASGRDIIDLSLPGRLGFILAGDANPETPAIRHANVGSFGLDSVSSVAAEGTLISQVHGNIRSFVVKHDFAGANLVVSEGGIQSLVIGGNVFGNLSAIHTGITVEKSLIDLRIGGTIRGIDLAHPVEIKIADGVLTEPVEALHYSKVGGDVSNTNVIIGNNAQARVQVGEVLVTGSWSASNLLVGAGAGLDGLFGTVDDVALQDTASSIARITIRSTVTGTPAISSDSDHFGFVAGRIAAFQFGGRDVHLTKWKDSIAIGFLLNTLDVMLQELAGKAHP